MRMIVSYDLDGKWWEVKQEALAIGFEDHVVTNDGIRRPLPNTTLMLEAPSPEFAEMVFLGVATRCGATVTAMWCSDWNRGVARSKWIPGWLSALLGRSAA